jgi:hypothetical protein
MLSDLMMLLVAVKLLVMTFILLKLLTNLLYLLFV